MKPTREHIVWAYRLFLSREPESEQVVQEKLEAMTSIEDVRREFVESVEFQSQIENIRPFDATNIVIKEITDGLRLFVDLADSHVGIGVINSTFEKEERAFVTTHVKEGDVAVDVGANIGLFSILMSERVGPTGHVFAFEPLERNARLLERSVAENRFSDRVTIERAAIGEAAGELEFITALATNNWGGSYLRTRGAEVPQHHRARTVKVVALDDYPLRRPVQFIKIDVEGAELLALRGMKQLLRSDLPTVIAELNSKQLAAVSGASSSQLIKEMREMGYVCRPLGPGGLEDEIGSYDNDAIINVVFMHGR